MVRPSAGTRACAHGYIYPPVVLRGFDGHAQAMAWARLVRARTIRVSLCACLCALLRAWVRVCRCASAIRVRMCVRRARARATSGRACICATGVRACRPFARQSWLTHHANEPTCYYRK